MISRDITVNDLQEMLRHDTSVRILDIRGKEEHREWSIPGSEHLTWRGDHTEGTAGPLDCGRFRGDDPVVVVCARGRTSRKVAEQIRERCGVHARSLEGGMAAWSFAWNSATVSQAGDPVSVLQLRRTGKGCLSYLLASEGKALVVDPSLDADVYVKAAEARAWSVEGVLETHIHADHVSRGRQLAEAVGASHYLPEQNRTAFEHRVLRDGDSVPFGGIRLTALHTPGHTGESHSYLLDDRYLFTGDTLFLDAVGRPDLEARGEADEVRRHARLLHRSLFRLTSLSSDVLVLPGHTGEPVDFDGSPVAASLGEVRERVEAVGASEEAFVARLASERRATPPNYERIVALNEAGAFPSDDLLELEAGANRCAAG